MDSYVSMIIKQGAVLGLAVGIVVALAYIAIQYPKLQYAMSLNMLPGQLP